MTTYAGQYGPDVAFGNSGAPVPNATITVYESDGTTLSTLYTDRTKNTTTVNPTVSDAAGNFLFFTSPGQHVVKLAAGTVSKTVTVTVPNDPAEDSAHYQSVFAVASPTGVAATDTANIQAAINSAQAVGGVVFLQIGQYKISSQLDISNPVIFRGSGRNATSLKAMSAMAAIVSCTATAVCVFEHMTLDGNSLATNCHIFTVTEASIPHIVEDVQALGATGYQFVNAGCEDVTYIACTTSGDESAPTGVHHAIQVTIPNGAATFLACQFFGQVELTYQQFSIIGGVAGPLYLHNASGGSQDTLALTGVYVYDGGVDSRPCVSSADVVGLTNVAASGCYFVVQTQDVFVGGAIPGSVALRFDACMFIEAVNINPAYIVQASGAGSVRFRGCRAQPFSGATVNDFGALSSATTVVRSDSAFAGVTLSQPGALSTAVPASGTPLVNTWDCPVIVYSSGGTRTSTVVNAVTIATTNQNTFAVLAPGDEVVFNYTVAPTTVVVMPL